MIDREHYQYTGKISDNGGKENCINCARCTTKIRYEFELISIQNQESTLLIGCECVKKFDLFSGEKATKDLKKYLHNQSESRVLEILIEISKRWDEFDVEKTTRYFERRGGFTPKQILMIHKSAIRYDLIICKTDFKVKLSTDRDKTQLRNLCDVDKETIKCYLSTTQIKRYYS